MPELPDLNVFSRNLNRRLKGKKLDKVRVGKKSRLKVPVSQLKKAVEGTKLKNVKREGKELHLQFSNGNVLGLHLMLHGKLDWSEGQEEPKNIIIGLDFRDGTRLDLSDYQHAAHAILNPEEQEAPDALSSRVNYSFLKKALSTRRTAIKTFLMDQQSIRGIGNAYSDEILWRARIAPLSVCRAIPDAAIRRLARSIKSVLKEAEKQIIKRDPDIISGEERSFLKIHNAKKKKSPTGIPIRHKTVHSRITYYTSEQELYK